MKIKAIQHFLPVTLLLIMALLPLSGVGSDNWTHFRGNDLNGISTVEKVPTGWDAETNIVWKTPIHGRGWSSPVVYGNQIWVSTASTDGKEFSAVCIDFSTGEIIYDLLLFTYDEAIRKHDVNSFASPTPAIENGYVYVHFGSLGTACIRTTDGTVVWSRTDLECDHVQGPGSSAFLYNDLLILHYEGVDVRFLVGLDKRSGETIWKTHRQEEPYEPLPRIGRKAYVTPLLVNVDGRDMIISNGSAITNAYDPLTGEEIWGIVRGAETTVAMPFEENGVVYFITGFMVDDDGTRFSELMAVNPSGNGDITNTHVLWSKRVDPFPLSTPVVVDGLIYMADRTRTIYCIDAANGDILWSHRIRSEINSSPVFANGNVYFNTTRGETLVFQAGREMNIIAENQLEGEIWATPAFLRNSILNRTDRYLYRIGY